ncbi:MAG: MATE family efflux transporter [Thermoproteales archaeon]|nr:MATE family efflux transporter [Thermoproteales archaeon]
MRKEYTDILKLAWPVIIANLISVSFYTIDTMMIGRLGSTALAAVGLAGQLLNLTFFLSTAINAGTLALSARRKGEEKEEEIFGVLANSILLALVISLPLTLIFMIYPYPFFSIFVVEESVLREGAVYLSLSSLSIPLTFSVGIFSAAYRGVGDTLTPMIITFISGALKVVLNYLFIYGVYGFPYLGVVGLALSTIIANAFSLSLFFITVYSGRFAIKASKRSRLLDFSIAKKIFSIGFPSLLEQASNQVARLVYTAMVSSFGTEVLAAQEIGLRVESLSFMPGLGFSVATASLVGQSLGRGESITARRVFKAGAKMASLLMIFLGVFLFLAAEPLSKLFIEEETVIEYSVLYLRIMSFQQPFLGLYMVYSGGLRGSGDTKSPFYASLISIWSLRIGLGYLLGFIFGWRVAGVWIGGLLDFILRAIFLYYAYRIGRWEKIRL